MNAILPVDKAKSLCLSFMTDLDNSSLGKSLKEQRQGRMFGLLLCSDGTIYKAYSGDLEYLDNEFDFVPPCYDKAKMKSLLKEIDKNVKEAKDNSKVISQKAWKEVLSLYYFHTFDGSIVRLIDIFPNAPSGTGDCCAPKLLSYAYKNNKKPISLCEFFYGSGSYEHKSFHTPCDARCSTILPFIIGLDIIYCDNDIVVVNKKSGMLSIEGKGPDKSDCVASRVRNIYQNCISQPCVHRLDQATSGLMVLALTKIAHAILSKAFENREVYKEYEALVDNLILQDSGSIDLPIRLDVNNRPSQIVDFENGKKALTYWQKLSIENRYSRKCTRLKLIPKTGRTHQLRLHCKEALNAPILGDRLYGREDEIPRLMLQARVLEFNHPVTNKRMRFELKSDF